MRRQLAALAGALAAIASTASAQAALDRCEASTRLSKHRYLRQLSLDLLGRSPTFTEYQALDAQGDVTPAAIRAMIDTEAFKRRSALHHLDLLWPNVAAVDLTTFQIDLIRDDPSGIHWRPIQGITYRGAPNVRCLDQPASIVNGVIATTPVPGQPGQRQEGWVMVEPYWAPGTQVKLCAFDAQVAATTAGGVRCNTLRGLQEPECGCGPRLNYCQAQLYLPDPEGVYRLFSTEQHQLESFRDEALKIIDDVVTARRPYLEILSTNRGYVNGPIAHFYTYQRELSNFAANPPLLPLESIPALPLADRSLKQVERPALHAGVLTTVAYLLRFQTDRSRANRFSNAFLCSPFMPPAGGLPSPDSDCAKEPDLQARCGCKYCHIALEPMAAYWGRFAQNGISLRDQQVFPGYDAACADCTAPGRSCSARCQAAYVTTAQSANDLPYLGMLKELQYLSVANRTNLEEGPKLLVQRSLFNDRLPACVVRGVWKRFLGRPMTAVEEASVLPSLVERFVSSAFDFKALVEAVVLTDAYRSIG